MSLLDSPNETSGRLTEAVTYYHCRQRKFVYFSMNQRTIDHFRKSVFLLKNLVYPTTREKHSKNRIRRDSTSKRRHRVACSRFEVVRLQQILQLRSISFEEDNFWMKFLDIESFVEEECTKKKKELTIQIKFSPPMLNIIHYSACQLTSFVFCQNSINCCIQ